MAGSFDWPLHPRLGLDQAENSATSALDERVLLRERLATLGQLLSGIIHELNNPLTAVTGYADLLRRAELDPRAAEQVEFLSEEASRANRILKSLLLFARGEENERGPVDVIELLERAVALRAYELKVQNIRVVRDYAAESSRLVASPTQLQQVFLNIILNAEQAIAAQGRPGCITLHVQRPPGRDLLQVEIADDGPGIDPAVLPRVFDPFFTTRGDSQGTGLGLSLSRAIVRQHGGELGVTSEPGLGATFRLLLPVGEAVASPVPERLAAQPTRSAPRTGRRILVVDDEPIVTHLIADALRQQGFVVSTHSDSRRALREVSREPFDLVICDIRMPEIDGPTFYRVLLESNPALARRILFTTGDILARDTLRFLEKVRLPNLPKPFHVDELRAAVNNTLEGIESRVGVRPSEEGM